MTERVLDRLPEFDPRSRLFPVRALIGRVSLTQRIRHKRVWTPTAVLDQGSDGACVGFGWSGELGATPVKRDVSNDSAFALYAKAQTLDPWKDMPHSGSTVLAGAKAAVEDGAISSYHWCFSVDDVIDAVVFKGPVVVGTDWYNSMFETDEKGVLPLDKSTGLAGGHCWHIYGYIPAGHSSNPLGDVDVFAWQQSWGTSWGKKGRAFIRVSDFAELLGDQGEACVATDVRPEKAKVTA